MTDTLAADYADTMAESIREMMDALNGDTHDDECERAWSPLCEQDPTVDYEWCAYHDDDHDDPCDCQSRASDRMHEWPLELVAEKGEPFSVLLTFGGPNAFVEWSGRRGPDSATLEVWWGGDHAVRSSDAIRAFANYWHELMTEED